MQFTKRLREPVMRGEVTCSVRIWRRPHVQAGGRYALGPGAVHATAIREIGLADITPSGVWLAGGHLEPVSVFGKAPPFAQTQMIWLRFSRPSSGNFSCETAFRRGRV